MRGNAYSFEKQMLRQIKKVHLNTYYVLCTWSISSALQLDD